MSADPSAAARRVVVVQARSATAAATGLGYAPGVDVDAGAQRIAMQLVTIPPATRAKAHLHPDHETAAYVIAGEVVTWFGDGLDEQVTARAGEFILIPAGVPHLPVNPRADEPAVAVIARTTPEAVEPVVPLPQLDDLAHTRT